MSTRVERAKKYYKKHGFVKTVKKTGRFITNRMMEKAAWKYYLATEEELAAQRNETFSYNPKLSILIPMYQTPIGFFKELMETIQGQTYENWELCLADGSGEDTEAYRYVLELQKTDDRIKYKRLENNGGISDNTNEALDMATGEFIVLSDHDDLLTKDALYYVVKAINEDETIDTLYTDEDKINMQGTKYFEAAFKPDFNLDFFRAGNYICHMFVTRREIATKVRFKKEYDGAQDFDFIFRCAEASRRIYHVPRLLYHWRCHENSTAGNPESKLYAYEHGVAALQAHLDRCGIQAKARMSQYLGYYITDYIQVGQPKVSLITTAAISEQVLASLTYENLEVVYADAYEPADLNRAVNQATGQILFFLDPRMASLDADCFARLLAPLQREDLASVFAKVTNTDEVLYSAGLILGIRGLYGRAFPAAEADNNGYAMHLFIQENLFASDLACAMVRREDYLAAAGMDESMSYLHACVDLFLKMGQTKRHLFDPSCQAVITAKVEEGDEWIDFGDISKGEDILRQRWGQAFAQPDTNYSPNFKQHYAGYAMKPWSELRKERANKQ